MQQDNDTFRHESLQDSKTIRKLLESITDGLAKGTLNFSDGSGEIDMHPEGLLHLKLSAAKEEGRNRLSIRLTWHDQTNAKQDKKALKVTTSK